MGTVEAYWERIAKLLEERGIAREELAHRAGLTASYIYRITKGKVDTPSYQTVSALSGALGVPLLWLMEGHESGRPPEPSGKLAELAARYDIRGDGEQLIDAALALEVEDPASVLREFASLPVRNQDLIAKLIHEMAATYEGEEARQRGRKVG